MPTNGPGPGGLGGKQPKNRLPKMENEAIINETIRRLRLMLPGLVGEVIVSGGGSGGGTTRMLTGVGDNVDGLPMIFDDGSPMFSG